QQHLAMEKRIHGSEVSIDGATGQRRGDQPGAGQIYPESSVMSIYPVDDGEAEEPDLPGICPVMEMLGDTDLPGVAVVLGEVNLVDNDGDSGLPGGWFSRCPWFCSEVRVEVEEDCSAMELSGGGVPEDDGGDRGDP
ncbi:hypothetical protein Dimus_031724, partial [Dionaea muscipula]